MDLYIFKKIYTQSSWDAVTMETFGIFLLLVFLGIYSIGIIAQYSTHSIVCAAQHSNHYYYTRTKHYNGVCVRV